MDDMSVNEIWARTFDRVKSEVPIPMVWLAMQSVHPLAIDGNRFVVALPADGKYLEINLDSTETYQAIEECLKDLAGRPLAFHIIRGETLEDWETEKKELIGETSHAVEAPMESLAWPEGIAPWDMPEGEIPAAFTFDAPLSGSYTPSSSANINISNGFDTWEKLAEWISHEYKLCPNIRYAHGQAKFMMRACVKIVATMERIMPSNMPIDNNMERLFAKTIERVAGLLSLDAFFVGLEVMRIRQMVGLDRDYS